MTQEKIIISPAPPLTLSEGNFVNMVFKDVNKWWMKPAIECSESGVTYTYAELLDQINKWSRFLQSFGTDSQDSIAIISPNCLQIAPIFFGSLSLGTPATVLNPMFTSNELRRMILKLGSKFIVYSREVEDIVSLALKEDISKFQLFSLGKPMKLNALNVDDIIYGKNFIPFSPPPQITRLFVTPSILNSMITSSKCTEETIQSLDTMICSSAPVLRSSVDTFKKRFKSDIDLIEGYLNDQRATNDVLKNGWIHTGDVGYYDEGEYFFVTDRIKELIKVDGRQVSPTEIENELLKHPLVEECSVIGKPDPKHGELPLAFVVPKEEVSEAELHNFLKDKLVEYKQLKGGIKFVDSLPKSKIGKILKRELRLKV
ncbi:4-coumarate--CoA ligase-like 1 [Armadillidium vulgare]|nr:4-coumarate--CoA ligase-like 1 [Armadillidium vulgare]